ncbi:prunin 1 Pru du 6.0101-like [Malus domestica]|uniref:prunin 1 Pru du 6.0101-like n=1 Tax=Malus domestica TaxID=3750 RepID=UPI0007ED8439|nr:13S globulin basic chain-like [Malus domestica]
MVASKERKMVISHQMLRGSARVQVVNENGNPILDDQVQEGQLFIVPQNHGVITQAGNEGFEYIAFKTNDNAMISTLAGRTSILRALPLEVLANAYQIQRQQAHQLKYNYNRQETIALSSSQSFQRRVVA